MAKDNSIKYLEIHNTDDGMRTFNAGTRYDWYVINKKLNTTKTIIKDELWVISTVDLNKFDFLPNFEINFIKKLLKNTSDEGVNVIYSRTQYGTEKEWVKEISKPEGKFIHPLIHSTPKGGPRIFHSSTKTPPTKNFVPMFGIKKVIFGESGINDVIIDVNGDYGLTQEAIGIEIRNEKEGKTIKKIFESSQFKQKILIPSSFGNFRIDWRLFKYFKKDFWKEFVDENGSVKGESSATLKYNKTKPKKTSKVKVSVNSSTNKPIKEKDGRL